MEVTGLAAVLLAIALLLVVVSAVQPVARRFEVSEPYFWLWSASLLVVVRT